MGSFGSAAQPLDYGPEIPFAGLGILALAAPINLRYQQFGLLAGTLLLVPSRANLFKAGALDPGLCLSDADGMGSAHSDLRRPEEDDSGEGFNTWRVLCGGEFVCVLRVSDHVVDAQIGVGVFVVRAADVHMDRSRVHGKNFAPRLAFRSLGDPNLGGVFRDFWIPRAAKA